MSKWQTHVKSVKIPDRLLQMRQHRGYVVTFMTAVDSDGNPKFRWVDDRKRLACFQRKLCGICGEPLEAVIVNIIATEVLNDPSGDIICREPFMHAECAEYAAQVCPFIAIGTYKPDPNAQQPNGYTATEWDMPALERPKELVLYYTDGFRGPYSHHVLKLIAVGNKPIRPSKPIPLFNPTNSTGDTEGDDIPKNQGVPASDEDRDKHSPADESNKGTDQD